MGTGSFPGVKRPGRGVEYRSISSADVKERVELLIYSRSGRSLPVIGFVAFTILILLKFSCYNIVKQLHATVKHSPSRLQKQGI